MDNNDKRNLGFDLNGMGNFQQQNMLNMNQNAQQRFMMGQLSGQNQGTVNMTPGSMAPMGRNMGGSQLQQMFNQAGNTGTFPSQNQLPESFQNSNMGNLQALRQNMLSQGMQSQDNNFGMLQNQQNWNSQGGQQQSQSNLLNQLKNNQNFMNQGARQGQNLMNDQNQGSQPQNYQQILMALQNQPNQQLGMNQSQSQKAPTNTLSQMTNQQQNQGSQMGSMFENSQFQNKQNLIRFQGNQANQAQNMMHGSQQIPGSGSLAMQSANTPLNIPLNKMSNSNMQSYLQNMQSETPGQMNNQLFQQILSQQQQKNQQYGGGSSGHQMQQQTSQNQNFLFNGLQQQQMQAHEQQSANPSLHQQQNHDQQTHDNQPQLGVQSNQNWNNDQLNQFQQQNRLQNQMPGSTQLTAQTNPNIQKLLGSQSQNYLPEAGNQLNKDGQNMSILNMLQMQQNKQGFNEQSMSKTAQHPSFQNHFKNDQMNTQGVDVQNVMNQQSQMVLNQKLSALQQQQESSYNNQNQSQNFQPFGLNQQRNLNLNDQVNNQFNQVQNNMAQKNQFEEQNNLQTYQQQMGLTGHQNQLFDQSQNQRMPLKVESQTNQQQSILNQLGLQKPGMDQQTQGQYFDQQSDAMRNRINDQMNQKNILSGLPNFDPQGNMGQMNQIGGNQETGLNQQIGLMRNPNMASQFHQMNAGGQGQNSTPMNLLNQNLMGNQNQGPNQMQHANNMMTNDTSVSNLSKMAEFCATRGDYPQAIDYYRKLIAIEPNSGASWTALGHCYLLIDDVHKAFSAYQHALYSVEDMNDPQLWYGIGILYERFESYDNAVSALIGVLKMSPNFYQKSEVLYKLGTIFAKTYKIDEAIKFFQNSILTSSFSVKKKADTLIKIGLLNEEKKDFLQAKKSYEAALSLNDKNVRVYQHLAWCSFRHGNIESALRNIHKAEKRSKENNVYSLYIKGRCLICLDNPQQALECLSMAVQLQPNEVVFWTSLAVLLYNMGRIKDSFEHITHATQIKHELYEVWYNLGILYETCRQPDEALIAYDMVLSIDRLQPDALKRIATIKSPKYNLQFTNENKVQLQMKHPNYCIPNTLQILRNPSKNKDGKPDEQTNKAQNITDVLPENGPGEENNPISSLQQRDSLGNLQMATKDQSPPKFFPNNQNNGNQQAFSNDQNPLDGNNQQLNQQFFNQMQQNQNQNSQVEIPGLANPLGQINKQIQPQDNNLDGTQQEKNDFAAGMSQNQFQLAGKFGQQQSSGQQADQIKEEDENPPILGQDLQKPSLSNTAFSQQFLQQMQSQNITLGNMDQLKMQMQQQSQGGNNQGLTKLNTGLSQDGGSQNMANQDTGAGQGIVLKGNEGIAQPNFNLGGQVSNELQQQNSQENAQENGEKTNQMKELQQMMSNQNQSFMSNLMMQNKQFDFMSMQGMTSQQIQHQLKQHLESQKNDAQSHSQNNQFEGDNQNEAKNDDQTEEEKSEEPYPGNQNNNQDQDEEDGNGQNNGLTSIQMLKTTQAKISGEFLPGHLNNNSGNQSLEQSIMQQFGKNQYMQMAQGNIKMQQVEGKNQNPLMNLENNNFSDQNQAQDKTQNSLSALEGIAGKFNTSGHSGDQKLSQINQLANTLDGGSQSQTQKPSTEKDGRNSGFDSNKDLHQSQSNGDQNQQHQNIFAQMPFGNLPNLQNKNNMYLPSQLQLLNQLQQNQISGEGQNNNQQRFLNMMSSGQMNNNDQNLLQGLGKMQQSQNDQHNNMQQQFSLQHMQMQSNIHEMMQSRLQGFNFANMQGSGQNGMQGPNPEMLQQILQNQQQMNSQKQGGENNNEGNQQNPSTN